MSAFDFAMLRRTVGVPLLMTFAFASAQAQELPSCQADPGLGYPGP